MSCLFDINANIYDLVSANGGFLSLSLCACVCVCECFMFTSVYASVVPISPIVCASMCVCVCVHVRTRIVQCSLVSSFVFTSACACVCLLSCVSFILMQCLFNCITCSHKVTPFLNKDFLYFSIVLALRNNGDGYRMQRS